jgi:stage II sporulation protein AB (anti-sigma F factor)
MQEKEIYRNEMKLLFNAKSENESLARVNAAAFVAILNPTLEQVADIKTAVSEAVTNAIIHGCRENGQTVEMYCKIVKDTVEIHVIDKGCGIADIEKARTPLFTTDKKGERSGMGFTFMECFMDELEVLSKPGEGTEVVMKKNLGGHGEKAD